MENQCIKCRKPSTLLYCQPCRDEKLNSLKEEANNSLNTSKNCVYSIKCVVNNMCYIGSAANFKTRKLTHLSKLKRGKHHNKALQLDYNKYGLNSFVIEVISSNNLNLKGAEYELINSIDTNLIYNISINTYF